MPGDTPAHRAAAAVRRVILWSPARAVVTVLLAAVALAAFPVAVGSLAPAPPAASAVEPAPTATPTVTPEPSTATPTDPTSPTATPTAAAATTAPPTATPAGTTEAQRVAVGFVKHWLEAGQKDVIATQWVRGFEPFTDPAMTPYLETTPFSTVPHAAIVAASATPTAPGKVDVAVALTDGSGVEVTVTQTGQKWLVTMFGPVG